LQALGHTGLGATFLQTCYFRAIWAFESILALAGPIEAQPMLAALVQLSACFEAAIVARPTRRAVTGMCLTVASTVTVAVVWTLGLRTVVSSKIGRTVTSSIEALPIGLIAARDAGFDPTINTRPSVRTSATLGLRIVLAVVIARALVDLHLHSTLETNEARRTQTISLMALSSV